MNDKTFNKTIERKQESLKKIMDSNYPINPDKTFRHEERVWRASEYYGELNHLCLATDKEIFIVSKGTFEKRVDSADFATIESDGQFHMLASVSSFPSAECYLVWLAPLSDI